MSQTTSDIWSRLLALEGTRREYKFEIDGVTHGSDAEISHSVDKRLFEEFGIGNATCATLTLTVVADNIPRSATVKRFVRLINGDDTSEWIPQGVFFTNRRASDDDVWTLEAFDAMRRADQVWEPDQSLTFPMSMDVAVSIFCGLMDVELDERTNIRNYTIDYPANDYTIRDILRHIAAANGGNWIITDEGKLRLVPLVADDYATHDVGQKVVEFADNGRYPPIYRVTLKVDDENALTIGDDDGLELVADCPYATQEMVSILLAVLSGYEYQAYTATAVELDPAVELGDLVTVCGVSAEVAVIEDDGEGYPDISAPGELELEDEYPSVGPATREIDRKLATTRSLITKTAEEIGLRVEGLESDYAELEVALDGVAVWVEDVDGKYTQLKTTVDGVTVTDDNGTTKIKGSSIETSTLKVNAANITGQLTVGNLPDGVAMDNDIPVKTSDLTNDSGFASLSSVQSYIDRQGYTDATGVVTIINGTVNADYINALGVTAAYLQGNVIGISSGSTTWGAIYPGTNSADITALTVDGTTGLRLQSSGGNVYLRSSGGQFLQLGQGICQLGGGPLVIPGYSYGTTLPSTGVNGQVFFLISG